MKLSEWARGQGVSYRTALNWFHAGTLPVAARQLPTGTIVVEPSAERSGRTVAYWRVSSGDRRDEVGRQAGRVGRGSRWTRVHAGCDGDRGRVGGDRRPRHAGEGPGRSPGGRGCGGAPRPVCPVRCRAPGSGTRGHGPPDHRGEPRWGERRRGAGHDLRSWASMCAGRSGRRSARRRAEAGVRCATAEVVTEVVTQ